MVKKTALLIVFSVVLSMAKAQDLSDERFRYLTPKQGLSQSNVTAITQDKEGFMWFGTQEGLNKYEGQNGRVVIYKHDSNDSTSIGSNEVEDIFEDSRGNLWIATDYGGLNLYNRDKNNFKRYIATDVLNDGFLSDNTVQVLAEDSRNNFWIGTYSGLNLMDREKETFRNFVSDSTDPASLSSNYITDIYEDKSGNLWVGTNNGLNRLKSDSYNFERIFITENASYHPTNYIHTVFNDSHGNFWIGTESGLYTFDESSGTFLEWDDKLSSSVTILDIIEDESGVIWVGTENEGLLAIYPDTNNSVLFEYSSNTLQGLNNNSIYSLYQSRDDILWIGTFDGGLNILDRKKNAFRHYRNNPGTANSLNENSIFSFLKPKGNEVWIGTDGGGINLFNPETNSFRSLQHDPLDHNSLSSNVVMDMIQDSQNIIWIGTYDGGLVRYNPETKNFKTFKYDADNPNSLSHDQIFLVFEDSKGNIWAGTNGGGLNKFVDEERGIFERWSPNSSAHYFSQNFIRDMVEDPNGAFWISTYGGGITHLNTETGSSKTYNSHQGNLSAGVVQDIYIAKNGTMWLGTKGGGLARYNSETDQFQSYNTGDGLPNNIVNAILEDDHGNIWASTNNGITRFSPENENFKNYTPSDGLQSKEFKPKAALKDEEGIMYFGGVNGFNRFHPDSIKDDTLVLPVAFTEFQLSNKTVEVGEKSPLKKQINQVEEITLPHNETNITIKYSVLNYDPQQEYTYAYILEGFDTDWNEVGEQNSATYTNLDPGEYIFKVKTANSDGYWGRQNRQVRLVINPPFWKTPWFFFLSVITIGGLIFGGFKFRTRQITSHNKRLEKEVNKRTQELIESNNDLKKALTDLKKTRKELVLNAHKAGMADIAAGVVHNIGNVLNSINTSTSISAEILKKSKFGGLKKANQLLEKHDGDLDQFLSKDTQGKKLVNYLKKLDESVSKEFKVLIKHNERLERKVSLINDVIAAQQSYANVGLGEHEENLIHILEDTLTIFSASFDRAEITIEKDFKSIPNVSVQKTKLVHVILNVLKNAKESTIEAEVPERIISMKVWPENNQVILKITDNGVGIEEKHLAKVFNHGFTTKKDGHGFGLHSSANYMTEMGAKIEVQNREDKRGAVFILKIPISKSGEFHSKIYTEAGNEEKILHDK